LILGNPPTIARVQLFQSFFGPLPTAHIQFSPLANHNAGRGYGRRVEHEPQAELGHQAVAIVGGLSGVLRAVVRKALDRERLISVE
jgi:hypothetical protein